MSLAKLIFLAITFGVVTIGISACSEEHQDPYQSYAEKDYTRAKKQLGPLVEKGDLKAMTHLAAIYQMDRDYEQAIKLYTQAARQNYAAAQYNLGIIKHEGIGTEKNTFEAYSWFYLATELGHGKANEQLRRMTSELTPNQTMQAKAWAKEQIIKL